MSCPWWNVPNSAIWNREDENGSRYTAIAGFGGRARWHVRLYADGDQFDTWNDDRDEAVTELQDMRRLARERREAINRVENGR